MTITASIQKYTDLGWHLVPIPAGQKGPSKPGWNQKPNALTGQSAVDFYSSNPTWNVGLIHQWSGTCAIDIDHMEWTRIIFDGLGLDLDAIMASTARIRGRDGRGKLIFRAHRDDLSRHSISWPNKEGRGTTTVFELRGGLVQDVLPPSIHPDTMQPYAWEGVAPADIPVLPKQLQVMWDEWDRFRPQIMDLCPWKIRPEYQAPVKVRSITPGTSVIDAYNAAHTIGELLIKYGYKRTAPNRYLSPNSGTGLAGCNVFDNNTAFSHHGSDPFGQEHAFDCFELYLQCEHAGNMNQAIRDAAAFLNISVDPTYEWTPEAKIEIEEGRVQKPGVMPSLRTVTPDNPLASIPAHLLSIPGVLQDVVRYYETTAIKTQPQFAVQAAIALGAVAMGRRWTTPQRNFSNLYLLNIGETGCGKEHAKTVIEAMLDAAQLGHLLGPAGYTSASGVFSALISRPIHIAVIDELGRTLKSAANRNMQHKADSLTAIMECFGRQDGVLRPQGYATIGLSKEQADAFEKVIRRPSLTLLGMSTPSEFYGAISGGDIASGLLNRFLIVKSEIGVQMSQERCIVPIGDRIIGWLQEQAQAHGTTGNLSGTNTHDNPPEPVEVPFTRPAMALLREYEAELVGAIKSENETGLEAMYNRSREIAMRISLIVARSLGETEIGPEPMQWAIDYVRFYNRRAIAMFRDNMAESSHQAICKAVIAKIKAAGLKGLTEAELGNRISTFDALTLRDRSQVMDKLAADYGIQCRHTNKGQRGRPRMAWFIPAPEATED
jgi:hypothetical protein